MPRPTRNRPGFPGNDRSSRRRRQRREQARQRYRGFASRSRGPLQVESLEQRLLLTADPLPPLSFDAMRDRLAPYLDGISGVTVVTHGYQPQAIGDGDSLMSLADAIYDNAKNVAKKNP